jgi:hypothetical protein
MVRFVFKFTIPHLLFRYFFTGERSYIGNFLLDTGCTAVNVVITKEVADIIQLHGSEQRNIRTGSGLMPFSRVCAKRNEGNPSKKPSKPRFSTHFSCLSLFMHERSQSVCDEDSLLTNKLRSHKIKYMTDRRVDIESNC